jgi:uroporphyrin-III C-methyltransferase
MTGKVYIVGAGPGAADLLTLRAVSILRVAEVVLHDDLVSQEVLALASSGAEIINVGKRCGRRGSSQEQINALMVEQAQHRKHVVRLKSGDPAIFGRLGEELDALREAQVPFEIVPGVTAASAAAAGAGLPLTDRRAASALVTITAHNCRNQSMNAPVPDPARSTFAVYMPGPDFGRTASELLELGWSEDAPCVLVSHAGRVTEQVHRTTLGGLQFLSGIPAPAMLIVGEVTRPVSTKSPADAEHSSSVECQFS